MSIRLENLTKAYATPKGLHRVLDDVSLTIPAGKSVGIIGRNGAGKSTLLRILGGIDHPDCGRVVTDKRISWPTGLTGGLQGGLTGRENAKFVCRLYARDKAEIAEKIAYVKAFAEIGHYFDMPVKSYSSGMRSRLAFGLSMAFDFDYYLIDEVLSVGDSHFRRKAHDCIREKASRANFLMVTHEMAAIRRDCDMVLLVGQGNVRPFEDVEEGIDEYEKHGMAQQAA